MIYRNHRIVRVTTETSYNHRQEPFVRITLFGDGVSMHIDIENTITI